MQVQCLHGYCANEVDETTTKGDHPTMSTSMGSGRKMAGV